jgi:hypothetical protein
MKKLQEVTRKKLRLSRETLTNLDQLQLEKVAGGSGSTCKVPPYCTC